MGKVGVSRDRECPKEELMLARLGKSHKTTQFQYQFNDESARLMGAASAEYLLQLVFYSHHITTLHPGHLEQRLDIMGRNQQNWTQSIRQAVTQLVTGT